MRLVWKIVGDLRLKRTFAQLVNMRHTLVNWRIGKQVRPEGRDVGSSEQWRKPGHIVSNTAGAL
jgi:hypothetical protein